MLSLVAAVSLCEVPGMTCELSINRHIWPEEDTANRHVLHGDFVRLRIDAASPSVDLHMALCEQESADAQRYIFGRSPSRSPTPTDSVQPEEEEYPSEEEAASASLLQLHAAMTSTILSGDSEDKVGLRTNERPIKLGGRAVLQDITNVARGPTESGKPPVKGLVSDGHAEGAGVGMLLWVAPPSCTASVIPHPFPLNWHELLN